MNKVQNKINIIRKILDNIEDECNLTELLRRHVNPNSRQAYKDLSPAQICFDLIKQIVEQDDLPENVHSINIYMDPNNQILKYKLVSFSGELQNSSKYCNIIWKE